MVTLNTWSTGEAGPTTPATTSILDVSAPSPEVKIILLALNVCEYELETFTKFSNIEFESAVVMRISPAEVSSRSSTPLTLTKPPLVSDISLISAAAEIEILFPEPVEIIDELSASMTVPGFAQLAEQPVLSIVTPAPDTLMFWVLGTVESPTKEFLIVT